MECKKCNALIPKGEEREHKNDMLCEDCYIDVLSPAVFCDPWASFTAESFKKHNPKPAFTENQKKILKILKETGGLDSNDLAEKLKDLISLEDGERDCAALHRMREISFENRNGSVFILPRINS